MTRRTRCFYCDQLAVAYRLERDGAKVPICAWHIPQHEKKEPPMWRPGADLPEGESPG